MHIRRQSLEALWRSAPRAAGAFPRDLPADLPPTARRYLDHALAPGTPLAGAVRLTMHGEIRLNGWRAFRAEQVIRRDGQMIWQARTRLKGLPVRGADALVDGRGGMDWRLLGLVSCPRSSLPL